MIIRAEYLYTTIPLDYELIYRKLLVLLAKYGRLSLDDCTPECLKNNNNVYSCYNMFLSAIAAYNLGNTALANALISYIKATIEQLANGDFEVGELEYTVFDDNTGILDLENLTLKLNDRTYYLSPNPINPDDPDEPDEPTEEDYIYFGSAMDSSYIDNITSYERMLYSDNTAINISDEGKIRFVAYPENKNIHSWVEATFNTDIEYVTNNNYVEINGINYKISFYKTIGIQTNTHKITLE